MKYLLLLFLLFSIFLGLQKQKEDYGRIHAQFNATRLATTEKMAQWKKEHQKLQIIAGMGELLRQYQSPMAGEEKKIYEIAEEYDLDYRLILGIAFSESTLGRFELAGTFNPYGLGCLDSLTFCPNFTSYEHSTHYLAQTLTQHYAYARFRETGKVEDIATHYLTGNKAQWVRNVKFIMEKL